MKRNVLVFLVLFLVVLLCLAPACGCAPKVTPEGEGEPGGNGAGEPVEPGEKSGEENGEEVPDPAGGVAAGGSGDGNILNGGLVAVQGERLYFSSPSEGGRLYSAALDGSNRVKLSDDLARYINATEQHLYYVAMGEPETIYDEAMGEEFTTITYGPIVRINLDGGGRKADYANPVANLRLAGERLYYQAANTNEPRIYSVKIDSSGKKMLTMQRSDFYTLGGGDLYYRSITDRPRLCGDSVEGDRWSVLYDGDAYFPNLMGSDLYFVGDIFETEFYLGGRSLYRISTSGGAASKVGDVEPAFLNCAGGWIYYSKAHSGEICRIRPDGSANELLSSDFCGGLFVFDEWIYYIKIDDENALYRMALDGSNRIRID